MDATGAPLFSVLTLVIPGDGALGLITSVPTAAGAIGLSLAVARRGAGAGAVAGP